MKKIRWYIWVSVLLVTLAGLSYLGWNFYQQFRIPRQSPLNAIPDNTALILKVNRPINLWNALCSTNMMWKQISLFPGMKELNTELVLMDSVARKHLGISGIIQSNSLYIAVTLSGLSAFSTLFLTSLPGNDPESLIIRFIKQYSNEQAIIVVTPYAETRIFRIQMNKQADPFFFSTYKGVFMASRQADLVKKSVDRLSINAPGFLSAGFRRVESTTGKKADVNIFVNFRFLSLFLYKQSRVEHVPALLRLSKYGDWCGADLIVKDDELLLGGYTVANDTNLHFLALFDDQKPQKIGIPSVIPGNTAWFVFLGLENPAYYIQQFHQRFNPEDQPLADRSLLLAFNEKYQKNLLRYFIPWFGNQAAIFSVQTEPSDPGHSIFAAFQTRDQNRTMLLIDSLSQATGKRLDSTGYRDQQIYSLHYEGVLPALLGPIFDKAGEEYAVMLEDFIIFGPDLRSVKYLIDQYQSGLTLQEEPVYKDFAKEVSPMANIYFYYNPATGTTTLKNLIGEPLNTTLGPVYDSLRKFEGLAFQFSNHEGIFYTSGLLRFNPRLQQEGPLIWETGLDTTITGQPQIISTGAGNGRCILVTDTLNNLYSISMQGSVLWKVHFMGKKRSPVIPVKIMNDDSLHYIFNTDSHLYMIRSDGTSSPSYPLRFPIPATSPITLTDFGIPYNYAIFVAFNDRRLYQFTLDGNSVNTWQRPTMKDVITAPSDVISFRNRNYICIRSSTGEALVVKRSGSPAFRLRPPFRKSPGTGFFINRSNRRGTLLTTDDQGSIVYISEDGKTSTTHMTLLDKNHYFFYEDITGNASPEFIFLDKSRLFFYDRSLKLQYSFTFRRDIGIPPFLVNYPGRKAMIGITFPVTREIFLFDGHGALKLKSGIRGTTAFEAGYVDNPHRVSLIVGDGKFLKNYRLTQP